MYRNYFVQNFIRLKLKNKFQKLNCFLQTPAHVRSIAFGFGTLRCCFEKSIGLSIVVVLNLISSLWLQFKCLDSEIYGNVFAIETGNFPKKYHLTDIVECFVRINIKIFFWENFR